MHWALLKPPRECSFPPRTQDLRSTNGTHVVDPATGDKTRLAPRKVTMLPEEGCRVHFGGVVCKVGAVCCQRLLLLLLRVCKSTACLLLCRVA